MASERRGGGPASPPPPPLPPGSDSTPGTVPGPGSPSADHQVLVVVGALRSAALLQRLLRDIEAGVRGWACDLDVHALDQQLKLFVSRHSAFLSEEVEGQRTLRHHGDVLDTQVLVNPVHECVCSEVHQLLHSRRRQKLLILAGRRLERNSAVELQDGFFSAADLLKILASAEAPPPPPCRLTVICPFSNTTALLMAASGVELVVNPPPALPAMEGLQEFTEYLSESLEPETPFQALAAPAAAGFLKLRRPCCYVFPAGRGNSAVVAGDGFNILVDGGSSGQPAFWKLARHLDRIDATVATHAGVGSLPGINALLRRKLAERHASADDDLIDHHSRDFISPDLGVVFANLPPAAADDDEGENPSELTTRGEAAATARLLANLGVESRRLIRNDGPGIQPLVLFQKLGVGQLELYTLSPTNQELAASSAPTACVMLVWHPAAPREKIIRVLFPGCTPQGTVLEGLDAAEHLEFLKRPTACTADLEGSGNGKTAVAAARKLEIKAKGTLKTGSLKTRKEPKKDGKPEPKKDGKPKRDPRPELRTDLKKDLKPRKEPEPKRDPKAEPKKDARPESRTDPKKDLKAKRGPEPKRDSKPEQKRDSKPEPKKNVRPELGTEQRPGLKKDPKADPKKDLKTKRDLEPQKNLRPESGTDSKPEPNRDSRPDSGTDSRPELKRNSRPEPKNYLKAKRDPEPKRGSRLESGTDSKKDLKLELKKDSRPESGTDPRPELGSKPELKKDSRPELKQEPKSAKSEPKQPIATGNAVKIPAPKTGTKDSPETPANGDRNTTAVPNGGGESPPDLPHDVDVCLVSPCEFRHASAAGSHGDSTPPTISDFPTVSADLDSEDESSSSGMLSPPFAKRPPPSLDPPPAPVKDLPPLPAHSGTCMSDPDLRISRKKKPSDADSPPPAYVELAYVPSGAAAATVDSEFFRRLRARHYVISGDGPAREAGLRRVLDALLDGKEDWPDAQVTLIPTFDSPAMHDWYVETTTRQQALTLTVLGSSSTVAMQDESFPACKVEF